MNDMDLFNDLSKKIDSMETTLNDLQYEQEVLDDSVEDMHDEMRAQEVITARNDRFRKKYARENDEYDMHKPEAYKRLVGRTYRKDRLRDLEQSRFNQRERNEYVGHYRDREHYLRRDRSPLGLRRHRTHSSVQRSAPSFKKGDSLSLAFGVIVIILIVLLIKFVCRGDTAFAGVTSIFLIVTVMGFINKGTGSSNKK